MTDLSLGWHVIEREHDVLVTVGGDAGPPFAGGSSAALLEFESYVLLQHLSICTVTVPHGSGKDFLTLLLLLL